MQYGAAFPQSEKDKDDQVGHWQAWLTPTSRILSLFISRQHLEYVKAPGKAATSFVHDHFKVQGRATPLRLIIVYSFCRTPTTKI